MCGHNSHLVTIKIKVTWQIMADHDQSISWLIFQQLRFNNSSEQQQRLELLLEILFPAGMSNQQQLLASFHWVTHAHIHTFYNSYCCILNCTPASCGCTRPFPQVWLLAYCQLCFLLSLLSEVLGIGVMLFNCMLHKTMKLKCQKEF